MSFVIGMAVIGAVGMVWIWAPAYPKPERHEHMRALDELARRRCAHCLEPVVGSALFCDAACQLAWETA